MKNAIIGLVLLMGSSPAFASGPIGQVFGSRSACLQALAQSHRELHDDRADRRYECVPIVDRGWVVISLPGIAHRAV